MKKIILLTLFIPMIFACEKEEINPGEPLQQFHLINFVDEAGNNLFEGNKISTSEFYYIAGDNKLYWEDLIAGRAMQLSGVYDEEFQQTVEEIFKKNEYLLLEDFQGERERIISVNGKQFTFRMSPLKEGFYLNGKAMPYSSDTIYNTFLYVHNIVLAEY